MKKHIIIISIVLLLLIVLFGTLSSYKSVEGMTPNRYVMYGPWIGTEIYAELKKLEDGKAIYVIKHGTHTKMVSEDGKEEKYYVGEINQLNLNKWNQSASTGGGKYLIKVAEDRELKKDTNLGGDMLTAGDFSARLENGAFKIYKNGAVIWASNKSNPTWTGSTLKIQDGSLKIGDSNIITGLIGADKLTLIYGDLVIKNDNDQVIWSLLSDEIQSTNNAVKEYITRGSRIYQSIELEYLKGKLLNYDNYINNMNFTNSADDKNYKALAELRRQMDFEISQLNGKDGSKLAVSTTTLQSAMYLNLGITVLAASLFVLIATR